MWNLGGMFLLESFSAVPISALMTLKHETTRCQQLRHNQHSGVYIVGYIYANLVSSGLWLVVWCYSCRLSGGTLMMTYTTHGLQCTDTSRQTSYTDPQKANSPGIYQLHHVNNKSTGMCISNHIFLLFSHTTTFQDIPTYIYMMISLQGHHDISLYIPSGISTR